MKTFGIENCRETISHITPSKTQSAATQEKLQQLKQLCVNYNIKDRVPGTYSVNHDLSAYLKANYPEEYERQTNLGNLPIINTTLSYRA